MFVRFILFFVHPTNGVLAVRGEILGGVLDYPSQSTSIRPIKPVRVSTSDFLPFRVPGDGPTDSLYIFSIRLFICGVAYSMYHSEKARLFSTRCYLLTEGFRGVA